MKFFWASLFLLLSSSSFSQGYTPYYNNTAVAEWHFDNERYDSAKVYLLQAFECNVEPKLKDVLMYARSLDKNGQTKKAFKFLKSYLKEIGGVLYPERLKTNKLSFTDKQWKKLDKFKLDTARTDYLFDMETNRMLEEMRIEDQKIRRLSIPFKDSLEWVEKGDTTIVNTIDKYEEIDTRNFQLLKKIINDKRFRNAKFISEVPLALITIHMEYLFFREIEGDLLVMVDEGVFDPYDFSSAKDRHYVQEAGDCLYYYAYVTGTNAECINYEDLVANRIAIGLSPYYSRTSIRRHIPVGIHGEFPLREHFDRENLKMRKRAGVID